jgi:hypothetical protein
LLGAMHAYRGDRVSIPARYRIAFVDQADAETARALSKRILAASAGAEQ